MLSKKSLEHGLAHGESIRHTSQTIWEHGNKNQRTSDPRGSLNPLGFCHIVTPTNQRPSGFTGSLNPLGHGFTVSRDAGFAGDSGARILGRWGGWGPEAHRSRRRRHREQNFYFFKLTLDPVGFHWVPLNAYTKSKTCGRFTALWKQGISNP